MASRKLAAPPSDVPDPLGEVVSLTSWSRSSTFKDLFFSLPEEFRAVAYLPPSDVVVDIHSIKDKEARMAICRRLNDLRRERLAPLASPSAKAFYQEPNAFPCLGLRNGISGDCHNRCEQMEGRIKVCWGMPWETPSCPLCKGGGWASADLVEAPSLPGLPATDGRASAVLVWQVCSSWLSAALPKWRLQVAHVKMTMLSGWRKVDIAQFSHPTFEIDARASRFPKKMNAQQALQTLPPLQAMGDVFKAVFGIYHRKLSKLLVKLVAPAAKKERLWQSCVEISTWRRMVP